MTRDIDACPCGLCSVCNCYLRFAQFTDAEVNAEFKRRNPPPPNPGAPTMKGKA